MLAAHVEQLEEPAAAELPPAQSAQPAALTVPGLVTVPEKPGAQMEQAATDVLAGPAVEMPAGQAVQLTEPAAE